MTLVRRCAPLFALAATAALALAGCRRGDDAAREALSAGQGAKAPAPFDWQHPRAALDLDAGEAARRIGSFEWSAEVSWRVHRGEGARSSAATEKHHLRQLADGAFAVDATVDDGREPGSETGRQIVYVNGKTWAKGRWAPWRERSTDLGHGAKRYRDESFRLAGDLAALCGPALALVERGTATVEGRSARRFALVLDGAAAPQRPGDRADPPGRSDDRDTRMRLELLEGAVPKAIDGELLADSETGVPLRVRLRATFGIASDPALRAEVTLDGGVTALGSAVASVQVPQRALPDERKPKGVAQALEAAGLKRKPEGTGTGAGTGERAEPQEEPAGE